MKEQTHRLSLTPDEAEMLLYYACAGECDYEDRQDEFTKEQLSAAETALRKLGNLNKSIKEGTTARSNK